MHSQPSTPIILHSSNISSDSPILVPTPSSNLDIPIVIWKGVRFCTQYPNLKFMSYHRLNSTYKAFATNLTSVNIPKNIQEALENPKWRYATLEEMRALE